MKGLILAGGLGTRLRPLTHTGAKQLIPVANKPVLEYGIDDILEAGVREIGIIVGYTPERIQSITDAMGDGSRWGARITYIEQDAPRGIAHAIYCAREFAGDDHLVVCLGDNILKNGIAAPVQRFEKQKLDAGVLLAPVEDPRAFGVAVLDGNGKLIDILEKPQDPPSDLAVIGVYYLSSRIFGIIERLNPSGRGEYEITDALRGLLRSEGCRVGYETIDGWWDDTGTAEAVLRANQLVLADLDPYCRGTVEDGVRIDGTIAVGPRTVVRTGSVIHGPVIIGADCDVGPTRIGPSTSIGDNCTIRGGEIVSSIIVGDVRIDVDSGQRIADSLIGRHTEITSADGTSSSGSRLILGENSQVRI